MCSFLIYMALLFYFQHVCFIINVLDFYVHYLEFYQILFLSDFISLSLENVQSWFNRVKHFVTLFWKELYNQSLSLLLSSSSVFTGMINYNLCIHKQSLIMYTTNELTLFNTNNTDINKKERRMVTSHSRILVEAGSPTQPAVDQVRHKSCINYRLLQPQTAGHCRTVYRQPSLPSSSH